MAIPAQVAADLIVIESEGFAGLQVLFDVPAASDSLHHGGQGRVGWRPDQVIGQLIGVVEAAAHEEPMATIRDPSLHHGQARPVKEALAFGAQALREALPLLGTQRLLRDAGYVTEQQAGAGLYTDHFRGGNSQGIGVALLLQEEAQFGAVTVDGIGDHPTDGSPADVVRSIMRWPSSGLVAKRTASGIWAASLRAGSAHQSSGRYNSRSMRA